MRRSGTARSTPSRTTPSAREGMAPWLPNKVSVSEGSHRLWKAPPAASTTSAIRAVPTPPSTLNRDQRWPGRTRSARKPPTKAADARSARAVGSANGRNPVGIVIPCHRVIAADAGLGGYAGGLDNKRWLLRHEGALLV